MKNKSIIAALVSMLIIALTSSCSYKYAVWLLPEPTVDNLTFVVGKDKYDKDSMEVHIMVVTGKYRSAKDTSKIDTLWHISQHLFSSERSEKQKYKHIKYGELPAGMMEKHRAVSLDVGEFLVHINMTGGGTAMRFRVLEDGSVIEVD